MLSEGVRSGTGARREARWFFRTGDDQGWSDGRASASGEDFGERPTCGLQERVGPSVGGRSKATCTVTALTRH